MHACVCQSSEEMNQLNQKSQEQRPACFSQTQLLQHIPYFQRSLPDMSPAGSGPVYIGSTKFPVSHVVLYAQIA